MRSRTILRLLALILIPLAAVGTWLWIQPENRMRSPDSSFFLYGMAYDEFDHSAMLLRGLNAERGRQPGAPENPFSYHYSNYVKRLETEQPLKDRYFLEYPHAALLIFRAGYWIQPDARDMPVPSAVLDGDYHNLAMHVPQGPEQERLWRSFVVASRFYVGVMVVCYFLLMSVLSIGYGPETRLRGRVLLLLLPATLYFTMNRYDVIPALLTALAFAALGRRWIIGAAIALALAVLIKVYPILFAPIILRYLWSDRRAVVRWTLAFSATGLLAFTPMLFGTDLRGTLAPYLFQLTRTPEVGMTIYGCFLPPELAFGEIGGAFRMLVLGGTLAALVYRPITSLSSVLRRCAILLFVFVDLAVFYSPQWILWFAPLLLPLAAADRRIGVSYSVLDIITYLTFPLWFWILPVVSFAIMLTVVDVDTAGPWNLTVANLGGNLLRFLRFGLCGVMGWQLIRAEWPTILSGSWLARRSPRIAWFLTHKI